MTILKQFKSKKILYLFFLFDQVLTYHFSYYKNPKNSHKIINNSV
jgi:hypothetical protein